MTDRDPRLDIVRDHLLDLRAHADSIDDAEVEAKSIDLLDELDGIGVDTLTDQERESLTVLGDHIGLQIRRYADLTGDGDDEQGFGVGETRTYLAMHHNAGAPRSTENGRPHELRPADVARLRALLNAAAARGWL